MASYKYKVYYGDSKCQVYNTNCKYILNMYKADISNSCPISTGGDITLNNGDILHINSYYGDLGDDNYGIGLSLESGLGFISWLILPSSSSWPQGQESGYGCFYDLNDKEYDEGNILRIYALPDDDYDTLQYYGNNYECYWSERACMEYLDYLGSIIIVDDMWIFTEDTQYAGTTVTLDSDEEIFISGPICKDGFGVYFTRSSGDEAFAYYFDDNDNMLAQTTNFWFGNQDGIPDAGYKIHIYDLGSDGLYGFDWGPYDTNTLPYFDEDTIAEYAPLLCTLCYDGESWYIDEDYSA